MCHLLIYFCKCLKDKKTHKSFCIFLPGVVQWIDAINVHLKASMNMKEGAFPCGCLRLCRSHDFRLAFAIPTPMNP